MSELSPDAADDAAADLERAADTETSRSLRWYAGVYLSVLFGGSLLALGVAVYAGIIVPEITVTATISIGWLIEYVLIAVAGLFVLFTASMILVILPGGIIGGLVGAIATAADAYERPDRSETQ